MQHTLKRFLSFTLWIFILILVCLMIPGLVSAASPDTGTGLIDLTTGASATSVPWERTEYQVFSNNVAVGPNGYLSTSGTTTRGIQECINASLISGNRSNQLGGADIKLGPGIFYITNTIVSINNSNPYSLRIRGSGMSLTAIVLVNSTAASVFRIGTNNSYNNVSFTLSDMTVATTGNKVTNMVYLGGYSPNSFSGPYGGMNDRYIERCYFGQWEYLTNNANFGFSPGEHGTYTLKNNIVAIWDEQNFASMIRIRDCQFTFCIPVYIASPRAEIINNQFMNAGKTSTPIANDWPTSHPLYAGACVTFNEPPNLNNCGGEMHYLYNNFFIVSSLGYLVGPGCTQAKYYSYNDRIESDGSGSEALAATCGNKWSVINHTSRPGTTDEQAIMRSLYIGNSSDYSVAFIADTNNYVTYTDTYVTSDFTNYLSGFLYTNIYNKYIWVKGNGYLTGAGKMELRSIGWETSVLTSASASGITNALWVEVPPKGLYTWTNTVGSLGGVLGGRISSR